MFTKTPIVLIFSELAYALAQQFQEENTTSKSFYEKRILQIDPWKKYTSKLSVLTYKHYLLYYL